MSGETLRAVKEPESSSVVFTVEPGVAYPVLKKGGPGREWCKLKGATGEGWVKCDGTADLPEKPRMSGEFLASRDKAPAAVPLPAQAPVATGCETRCTRPPSCARRSRSRRWIARCSACARRAPTPR
ncbi:hypothetical protein ACN28S_34325 [Cystobacter fuscus]